MESPRLIPLKTAARQLGISYPFIYAAHRAGVVKTITMGVKIMMPVDEVDRLMHEGIPAFRPAPR